MQAELKPCPFCGHRAEVIEDDCHKGYYVECYACFVRTPLAGRQDIVADIWNTRPIPTPADLEKWEALAGACDGLEDWLHGDECKCGQCYRIKAIMQALAALDAKEQVG